MADKEDKEKKEKEEKPVAPAPEPAAATKRYQNKRHFIEACQFDPEVLPWPKEIQEGGMEGKNNLPRYYVDTIEGPKQIVSGDWVVSGERFAKVIPHKKFVEAYEPAS